MARPKKEAPNHGDRYEVKITLGRKFDGRLERKSFFSTKSKQDAREKAERYKLECNMGQYDNSRITFAEFANKWLVNGKEKSVRNNTYEYTYKNCVENHLNPYFGRFPLCSIHKADIQEFLNKKTSLSESMLHKLRLTLNLIFEDACDNDIIYKNPCKHVASPRSKKSAKIILPYSADQVQKLISYAKKHPLGLSVLLLIKCGFRRSELLGLRWQDVDFENRRIHIRQGVTETNGVLCCGAPKSKTSARSLPMDRELQEILKNVPRTVLRHKGKGKNRIAVTIKNEYVISDSKGHAMRPSNWETRVYNRFMKAFHDEHPDIPILRPHGLRHTYGSRLYDNGHGLDIYTIQKLMGHSSIEVTTGIYVKHDQDFLIDVLLDD